MQATDSSKWGRYGSVLELSSTLYQPLMVIYRVRIKHVMFVKLLKYFTIAVLIVWTLSACKKYPPRKITGVYKGWTHQVHYQYGAPNNTDTIIYGEFTVTRTGDLINLAGEQFHEDSLVDGHHRFTFGDCDSEIKLSGDTLSAWICYNYNSYAQYSFEQWGVKVKN
jgi:hypothetical protein